MASCHDQSLAENLIDKEKIAEAVNLANKHSSSDFAWGSAINGIETLITTLRVEGIGDIPVPVPLEVKQAFLTNYLTNQDNKCYVSVTVI